MKTLTCALLLAAPLFAEGDIVSLDIPNTFTAGTPAVAADVNQNFERVATAVNASYNFV